VQKLLTKLLTVTGVWAQFESEKGGPVDTKLARRRLGDPKATAKKAKKEAEQAEAAAPEAPAGQAGEGDESEESGDE